MALEVTKRQALAVTLHPHVARPPMAQLWLTPQCYGCSPLQNGPKRSVLQALGHLAGNAVKFEGNDEAADLVSK